MIVGAPLDIQRAIRMRGLVDVYEQYGRWIARTWPRHPKHPRTPAQLANWAKFRRMIEVRKSLPEWYITLYKNTMCAPDRSYDDHLRSALWLNEKGVLDTVSDLEILLDGFFKEYAFNPASFICVRNWGIAGGWTVPKETFGPLVCVLRRSDFDIIKTHVQREEWIPSSLEVHVRNMFDVRPVDLWPNLKGPGWFVRFYKCYQGKKAQVPVYEPQMSGFVKAGDIRVVRWRNRNYPYPDLFSFPAIWLGFGMSTRFTVCKYNFFDRPDGKGNRYALILPFFNFRVEAEIGRPWPQDMKIIDPSPNDFQNVRWYD